MRKSNFGTGGCRSSSKQRRGVWAICLAVCTAAPSLAGYDPLSSTFTLMAIPDPQYYTVKSSAMPYYYAQMNWIAANQTTRNIAFVYGMGDDVQDGNPYNPDGSYTGNITGPGTPTNITGAVDISLVDPLNHNFEAEFARAASAFNTLGNAKVPYVTVPGNHDYHHWDQKKNPTEFLKYLGPQRYLGTKNFAGYSPVSASEPANLQYAGLDTYSYTYAGGYRILNIALQYAPDGSDFAWAQSVINANKGLPTILFTHDYQDTNGRDAAGNNIWANVVNNNSQVFMVLSGHISGAHQQVSTNAAGKPVMEILADYQDTKYGGYYNGAGLMRQMTFDTVANTVSVSTYSPEVAQLGGVPNVTNVSGTGANADAFTLNFDFAAEFGPAPLMAGKTYSWDPAQHGNASGGGAGTWSSGTANWFDATADAAWTAASVQDAASFGGLSGAVTVNAAGVSASKINFNSSGYVVSGGPITANGAATISVAGGAVTINSVIAGASGLTVQGGNLTLGTANTFSGGLAVSGGGTVSFSSDSNLGSSGQSVSLDNGTLNYTGNSAGGLTENRVLNVLPGGATLNVANPGTSNGKLVISGAGLVRGSSGITKTGAGWMTLYGDNSASYAGVWNVNDGVLEVGSGLVLGGGAVTLSGGEVGLNTTTPIANAITINSGTIGADFFQTTSTANFAGPINAIGNFKVRLGNFYNGQSQKVVLSGNLSGAGTMTTAAAIGTVLNPTAATVTLTGNNAAYSGGIVVAHGTVAAGLSANNTLGTGAITLAGGKLALQGKLAGTGAAAAAAPMNVSGFTTDTLLDVFDNGGTHTIGMDGTNSLYANGYESTVISDTGGAHPSSGKQLTGGILGQSVASATANTFYLTHGGTTVNTPFAFQSFSGSNALKIAQGKSGTLTLAASGAYSTISVLAASVFGSNETPNATIHFADGTSVAAPYKAYDWTIGTDAQRQGASIFGAAGVHRYNPSAASGNWDTNAYGLYETDIDLTNLSGVDYSGRMIASITFNGTTFDGQGRGSTDIFAVSGAVRPTMTSAAQSYLNNVSVSADSSIDVSGSLAASMGGLSIGSHRLSVSSSDVTSAAYSLAFNSLTLTGDATFDVASSNGGGAGSVSVGPMSGGGSITKTNSGTLKFIGANNTLSGLLTINNGTVEIDGNATLGGVLGSGMLAVGNGVTSNTVQLAAGSGSSVVSSLTIGSGATLDITNNRLAIHYGNSADPYATILPLLESGFNGGLENGTGIVSSTAALPANSGRYTVGSGDDGAGTILLMYTLSGDANLDGKVDFNDFLLLQNSFGQAGTRFDQGNFNYDGATDFNDFLALQNNFGQSVTGLRVTITSGQVATMAAFALRAVPEPTVFAVPGLATLMLARRRAR
ncbi:MAG: putative serine/threonine phosphatase [Phycisphaerales bacterium]|nr:putative serine/threonine phosphatase [Phycisphaerales bacterium]